MKLDKDRILLKNKLFWVSKIKSMDRISNNDRQIYEFKNIFL